MLLLLPQSSGGKLKTEPAARRGLVREGGKIIAWFRAGQVPNQTGRKSKNMKTVSIIYFSAGGHTAKMAEAAAKGAGSVAGIQVNVLAIQGRDIQEGRYQNAGVMETLDASDAIIFGSPTYMGNVAAQFKCFMDASAERWFGRKWDGKVAAGITISGSPSGDKLNTLLYLSLFAAQHGMVWVGNNVVPYGDAQNRNRLGSFLGVMGQAGQEPPEVAPNESDKLTAESLGRRVAELALKLR